MNDISTKPQRARDASDRPRSRRAHLLLARFSASGLQLAAVVAVTRTADVGDAAAILLFLTYVQVLSAIAAWGHPLSVLRDVAHAAHRRHCYSLTGSLVRVSLFGVGLLPVTILLPTGLFSLQENILMVGSAVAAAGARVVSQANKAMAREVAAIYFEFALMPLAVLAYALAAHYTDRPVTVIGVAATSFAACVTAVVAELLIWRDARPTGTRDHVSLHLPSGFWVLGLLSLMAVGTAHLPVLAAPAFLDVVGIANFIVAFRVASLATTILNALNSYYGPRYSRAYAAGDGLAIRALLRSSQLTSGALCLPLFVPVLFHDFFLLFGTSYDSAWQPYAALVLGQFVNATFGVVSYVLTLSHRQNDVLRVAVVCTSMLAVGWSAMYVLDVGDSVLFAATYSLFLITQKVWNLLQARRVLDELEVG